MGNRKVPLMNEVAVFRHQTHEHRLMKRECDAQTVAYDLYEYVTPRNDQDQARGHFNPRIVNTWVVLRDHDIPPFIEAGEMVHEWFLHGTYSTPRFV